jgi:hypothetical protein
MATVMRDWLGAPPSREGEAEAVSVAKEVHDAVRRAVSPFKSPSADELQERIPEVLHWVLEVAEEVGLTDDEVGEVLEAYVSRVLATRVSERLADTLAESAPARDVPLGQLRHWRYSLSNG